MYIQKHFMVDYLLNTFEQKEGETVNEKEEVRQWESETDDLRYLFTDLLEHHKMENLKGLKILKIENIS